MCPFGRVDVTGSGGHVVPQILLDAGVSENSPFDRQLTDWLYGGDARCRLAQEIILGVGGVRMLHALGVSQIERFHMNEGHTALLSLELLCERLSASRWDFYGMWTRCLCTTQTTVAAEHDRFSYELITRVLGDVVPLDVLKMLGGRGELNMTLLALSRAAA